MCVSHQVDGTLEDHEMDVSCVLGSTENVVSENTFCIHKKKWG